MHCSDLEYRIPGVIDPKGVQPASSELEPRDAKDPVVHVLVTYNPVCGVAQAATTVSDPRRETSPILHVEEVYSDDRGLVQVLMTVSDPKEVGDPGTHSEKTN